MSFGHPVDVGTQQFHGLFHFTVKFAILLHFSIPKILTQRQLRFQFCGGAQSTAASLSVGIILAPPGFLHVLLRQPLPANLAGLAWQ